MATTLYETHAEATHLALKAGLEALLKTFEGGELDGVQYVTNADLLEVFAQPLPTPNEQAADVTTPARINVWGICPNCREGADLSVHLSTVLTIDSTGRSMKLAAKSKAVNHACGQTTIRAGAEPQPDFGLEDIVRPEDAVSDDEREISDDDSDAPTLP